MKTDSLLLSPPEFYVISKEQANNSHENKSSLFYIEEHY